MAGNGEEEEETEYESDPEEVKMSLKMRRREASDDEDSDEEEVTPPLRAVIVDSEGESDGQGGAANYDEEEEEEEDGEEEYYDDQEEEVEEAEVVEDEYVEKDIGGGQRGGEGEGVAGDLVMEKSVEETDKGQEAMGQGQGEEEEKKKENEPFAVPTSGAFYMHDDRFRDNAGGKHRRTFGGRKLWESKDDRKWGHDKFEEMNVGNRHYEEGRRSSKYQGRGKARGAGRGYTGGNRIRAYGGNNNQNMAPKDVRGRGPRRYQSSMKSNSETLPPQNKQSAKSLDKTSRASSERMAANPNVGHEQVLAKKVASNLSSASPPFYPSGSSNKEITLTQKMEIQDGNHNKNFFPSTVDHSFSMPLSNSSLRRKNVIDSTGMDKLRINDSFSPPSAKALNNPHFPSSSSSLLSTTHIPQSKAQGRGVFQPPQTNNQVNKVSPPVAQASQRYPVQRGPVSASQVSSPPKASLSITTFEPGNIELPLESGKSMIAVGEKGKGVQGSGRGPYVYGGAQVTGSGGNMGPGHGDQNLPAFFPVMQFGGQHPGGMGVPAVGMAFPGYVAQPNGNPEMTWLPVLASAAGALGASYCPPYIPVDGAYHPPPTGQTSALAAPSKDNNLGKPHSEWNPQQRPELANDELSHRQNKPRRYSEMNFSQ